MNDLRKVLQCNTVIAYGSVFPKSPTDPGVVEKSLQYCIGVSERLKQGHTIITCDQAIFEIALGLQKKKLKMYSKLIFRMGGFHIATNFLCAIGHLMKDSGIED